MKRKLKLIGLLLAIYTGVSLFYACSKDESIAPAGSIDERGSFTTSADQSSSKVAFYGLTASNELVGYTIKPVQEVSAVPLTGMVDKERMMAIDFSTTGVLYGVSNKSLLYTIDPATGKSTAVSYNPLYPAINGSTVGLDFDSRTGQLRLMTDNEQNLKIDPATGKVVSSEFSTSAVDYSVNSIAYTNNFNSTTAGSLYAIDMKDGMVYRSSSTFGSFQKVGSMGLTTTGEGGFDINRDNSLALAVLYGHSTTPTFSATDDLSQDKYRLYNIDLRTGKATYMDAMTRSIVGIATTY